MTETRAITGGERMALQSAASDLHRTFRGVFGVETIEALLLDSFAELARANPDQAWLVLSAERFARQRLDALAHADGQVVGAVPAVLFLCVHNAGRSQMALGWFTKLAGPHGVAWSGGSEPGAGVNSAAAAAMAELGIDIGGEFPKPWTDEFVRAADVVVTMGCGDSCPLFPGKHYEDWEIPDPSGKQIEEVRLIRDEIGTRVTDLLIRLGIVRKLDRGRFEPPLTHAPPSPTGPPVLPGGAG
jgi:arsenate reductase (thioredoxin)